MKGILERVGLTEVLAYLAPGVVLLCSLGLWIPGSATQGILNSAEHSAILLFSVAVVLAYTLGLILSSWGGAGGSFFVVRKEARDQGSHKFVGLWSWYRVGFPLLWLFHYLPTPRQDETITERLVSIGERLEEFGLRNLPMPPWELLTVYRTVAAGRLSESGEPVLLSTGNTHNRLLFALGVGLALLLTSLQAAGKFAYSLAGAILSKTEQPACSDGWVYVAVAIVGLGGSLALRWAAGQLWERELYLTCSLLEFDRGSRSRSPLLT